MNAFFSSLNLVSNTTQFINETLKYEHPSRIKFVKRGFAHTTWYPLDVGIMKIFEILNLYAIAANITSASKIPSLQGPSEWAIPVRCELTPYSQIAHLNYVTVGSFWGRSVTSQWNHKMSSHWEIAVSFQWVCNPYLELTVWVANSQGAHSVSSFCEFTVR